MESKWKEAGQLLAHVQSIYGIARDVLSPMNVDGEILPWFSSEEGKPVFVRHLEDIAHEYKLTFHRIRTVPGNANAILVNLDAAPHFPCRFCRVKRTRGASGWVMIERRGQHLYMGSNTADARVSLFVHRLQRKRDKSGELVENLMHNELVLHPNVLEALLERPHLIPDYWKFDRSKNVRHIVFWGVVFVDTESGNEFVRTLSKDAIGWKSGTLALHYIFDALNPAAAVMGHC